MTEEMIISSESTGQRENIGLRRRAEARKLKEKQELTLAEKLLLASKEDTFIFTYRDIDIEVFSPTRDDFANFVELYNKVQDAGADKSTEETDAVELELFNVVADLCVDQSITPEFLQSGVLGVSFVPAFMSAIAEYQKQEADEVKVVKGFRAKKGK